MLIASRSRRDAARRFRAVTLGAGIVQRLSAEPFVGLLVVDSITVKNDCRSDSELFTPMCGSQ